MELREKLRLEIRQEFEVRKYKEQIEVNVHNQIKPDVLEAAGSVSEPVLRSISITTVEHGLRRAREQAKEPAELVKINGRTD